jgi:hypothetical protein
LIGAACLGYPPRMDGRRTASVGAVLLALAGLAWLSIARGRPATPAPQSDGAARPSAAAPAAHAAPATPAARERSAPPPDTRGGESAAGADGGEVDEFDGDAIVAAWAHVDLAEVRRALPDNRYWEMGAPTSDEAEIERRARERERWNVEYGKVLSGTGSEAEVRAYYDERARVSGDYVEFTTYLLDHYGEVLPARDVSLLQLARRLHLARLEEIPRNLEQALARKRQQDEARARWLADERAFAGDAPAPADDGR